jgi:hypothetical protein
MLTRISFFLSRLRLHRRDQVTHEGFAQSGDWRSDEHVQFHSRAPCHLNRRRPVMLWQAASIPIE